MRIILACIILTMFLSSHAQSQSFETLPPPARFDKVFTGTINTNLKIQMQLTRNDDELSGSYFYAKQRKKLQLRGTINDRGYFQLNEFEGKTNITGQFIGAFGYDNTIVGFWSRDPLSGAKLPVRLTEEAKVNVEVSNKFEVITVPVRSNRGTAQLLLIDGTLIGLSYENVGGNTHTCTLITDRSEKNVIWETNGQTTSINFTKKYFGDQEPAQVTINKVGANYSLTLEGNLQYFCGVRAMLPRKITLTKTGKGWIGVIPR